MRVSFVFLRAANVVGDEVTGCVTCNVRIYLQGFRKGLDAAAAQPANGSKIIHPNNKLCSQAAFPRGNAGEARDTRWNGVAIRQVEPLAGADCAVNYSMARIKPHCFLDTGIIDKRLPRCTRGRSDSWE